MSLWLKQSTSVTIQLGPFLDKTDGVTLEVGLAAALDNATTGIRLTKNGATQVDRNDATVPAYTAMGLYTVVLDATDTGTLGTLRIIFEEAATCLPVWQDFMIVPANVWDSLFGADALDVNTIQVGGTTQTANDNGLDINTLITQVGTAGAGLTNIGTIATVTNLTNLPAITANWLTAAGTAADFTTEIQAGLATPTNITAGTITTATNVTTVNGLAANVITAASIAAGAITDSEFTATGSGLSALALSAAGVDAILDETLTSHVTADSFAIALKDVLVDTADIQPNYATSASIAALNDIAATDIVSSGAITTLAGAVVNVDLVDTLTTYTGNTLQTGDVTTAINDLANGTDGLTALKAVLDTVATDTTTDIPALIATLQADTDDIQTRIPTTAELAYMVENAATGLPVTFTTAGGSTTVAVLNLVDGGAGSATNDQYNGRLLVFTDGTLKGVVTDITDYVGSTTTATITAIPFAPTSSHNARLI